MSKQKLGQYLEAVHEAVNPDDHPNLFRTVEIKVSRSETWYPTYKVPAHMNDFEAQEYIEKECPDDVYDYDKATHESETWLEILPDEENKDESNKS
jgi:hypothetical protein